MKKTRHRKIVEIIEKKDVETQEELAGYLKEAGFAVTQATVSRDIQRIEAVQSTHRWRKTEICHFKAG